MKIVVVKNVYKSFPQKSGHNLVVLKDINLTINKGEFVTLIGPSGCGKSTMLNIIAGLILPDKGRVLVNGKKVTSPGKDRVMVFQEGALFPWLTVLDNVMFGLKTNNIDKQTAYKRALEQLKAVHLHKFKDAYPHQLSGGMKQRVAIARALVMNPQILLMDEPFGALDEQTRLILHRELLEIWLKTRKTIVFVTHNIREAVKLSDRVIVFGINPGRILKEFKISIPHPRPRGNQHLIKIEDQILKILQQEVEKHMKIIGGKLGK